MELSSDFPIVGLGSEKVARVNRVGWTLRICRNFDRQERLKGLEAAAMTDPIGQVLLKALRAESIQSSPSKSPQSLLHVRDAHLKLSGYFFLTRRRIAPTEPKEQVLAVSSALASVSVAKCVVWQFAIGQAHALDPLEGEARKRTTFMRQPLRRQQK
jgi:hypothetical protein